MRTSSTIQPKEHPRNLKGAAQESIMEVNLQIRDGQPMAKLKSIEGLIQNQAKVQAQA